MQRRQFLQGSLLLGAAGAVPGAALAASQLLNQESGIAPSITGLVLPPLNASDLSALLYELLRDAIRMENIELIKFFLDQGADVNEKNQFDSTPLHRAIQTESLDVVKLLVSQGADVHERGIGGATLLHEFETYAGSPDVMKFLVSQGADVNATDNDGNTPLHHAARNDLLDAVKCLVSLGANVNAIDHRGMTPLHEGLSFRGECSVELVEYLLSQGADVHAQDRYGRTALDYAMGAGYAAGSSEMTEEKRNVIDVLQKASGVAESSSESSMEPEAEEESVPLSDDDTSMTELVLPPLDASETSSLLYYLLRDAISIENIELIKFALEQGADVNGASTSGGTPLHWAIWESSLDVVKLLVSQGADIHTIGQYGRTPLHWAVWKGSIDMADFLISQGADVNAMGGEGKTPLLESAQFCSVEMVEYLLSQGADVHAQDSNGKTALDRAKDGLPKPSDVYKELCNVIDVLQKAANTG
jgi:ankyrin repeat protein